MVDDIPNGIKPKPLAFDISSEKKEIIYVLKRSSIHKAIVWTAYIFQLFMAVISVYRAITEVDHNFLNHWSVVLTLLASLFVISWVEKFITTRDGFDD